MEIKITLVCFLWTLFDGRVGFITGFHQAVGSRGAAAPPCGYQMECVWNFCRKKLQIQTVLLRISTFFFSLPPPGEHWIKLEAHETNEETNTNRSRATAKCLIPWCASLEILLLLSYFFDENIWHLLQFFGYWAFGASSWVWDTFILLIIHSVKATVKLMA